MIDSYNLYITYTYKANKIMYTSDIRGSRKFCQRGSNSDNFCLVNKWREDPNTTISGSSWARRRQPMMAQH